MTFDASPYLQPARLVDIGGRRLNLYCTGEGSPTIILEAGLGDDLTTWRYVQPALARRTRVCAYDRAGMGFSEGAAPPRDALAVTEDLHVLLQHAEVSPPYILVGSSLGGLYALLFTERFRQEVAGLVLVDPSELSETEFQFVAPAFTASSASWRQQSASCLETVQRHPLTPGSGEYDLCVPAAKAIAQYCKTDTPQCTLAKMKAGHRAGLDYLTDFVSEQQSWGARTSEELRANAKALGSLPVTVLTGAKTFTDLPDIPEDQKIAAENLWIKMHEGQASLSSRGRHMLVADSGHVIQFDAPDAVTSAIESILDQLRTP